MILKYYDQVIDAADWDLAHIAWTWDADDDSDNLVTRRPYSRVESVKLYDAAAYTAWFVSNGYRLASDSDLEPFYVETVMRAS
jgi:hypothetical protein